MVEETSVWGILLSPPVLVTFIVCAVLAGLIIWLLAKWQSRQRERSLSQQRGHQEATIERLLDSVAQDKEDVIAEYEGRLRDADRRVAALELEVQRMRDRMSSSGLLGLFGGSQRQVVSALLLENEQLHELLAEKQQESRDLVRDMTDKLIDRMDQQTRDSARAIRYKQALLSAFLEHSEARALLDRMIDEGKVKPQLAPTESSGELPEGE